MTRKPYAHEEARAILDQLADADFSATDEERDRMLAEANTWLRLAEFYYNAMNAPYR